MIFSGNALGHPADPIRAIYKKPKNMREWIAENNLENTKKRDANKAKKGI